MTDEMTADEEYKMIKDEVEWAEKIAKEKFNEAEMAQKRFFQARFRFETLVKAQMDFVDRHSEYLERFNHETKEQ